MRSDRERHGLRADVQQEDLRDDDPPDGTPRRRERGNVDAHQRNDRPLRLDIRHGRGHPKDRNEVRAHGHGGAAPEEQRATPQPVCGPHPGERHAHVHDRVRDGDEERVPDANVCEERRAVCGVQ